MYDAADDYCAAATTPPPARSEDRTMTIRVYLSDSDEPVASGKLIRGDLVLLDDASVSGDGLRAVTEDGRQAQVTGIHRAFAEKGDGVLAVAQLSEPIAELAAGDPPWYCRVWPWLC